MSEHIDQSQFAALMQGLSEGSEDAAEKVLRLCGPVVFRVVRRRLARRSARFDSADVAQAVWASFFGRIERNTRFADPEELIRVLAAMAANKVRKIQRDHFIIQKRAAGCEAQSDGDLTLVDLQADAKNPTPSQMAMADELWERLLAETPRSQQQILYLRLDGKTNDEIAKSLGVTSRTVTRIMSRLQKRIIS